MASARYSRLDGRKPEPRNWSTGMLVVFVAVCLFGLWVMHSSSVVPLQFSDMYSDSDRGDFNAKTKISGNVDMASVKTDSTNFTDEEAEKLKQLEEDMAPGPPMFPIAGESGKKQQEEHKQQPQEQKKQQHEQKQQPQQQKQQQQQQQQKPQQRSPPPPPKEEKKRGSDQKQNNNRKNDSQQASSDDLEAPPKKIVGSDGDNYSDGHKEEQVKVQLKDDKNSKNDDFRKGGQNESFNENKPQKGSFSTQAQESRNEKAVAEAEAAAAKSSGQETREVRAWKSCKTSSGADYIPCLDNLEGIKQLHSTKHFEHRERHCPQIPPTCLVPLPDGYKRSIAWPTSRDMIWYNNVPHTSLVQYKADQNWVKVSGEHLIFPGGGTQFKNGVNHYINAIQKSVPGIAWGKHSRTVLDMGCGVASFGGHLFDKDVLTMSIAPKDEHEAQVQFALERGIPAMLGVMGTKRLPFPGNVYDIIHCARCRVPWHGEGGKLLLELNRLLRPGGYFVWSATPVYQKDPEHEEIWRAMEKLRKSMCWKLETISKDTKNEVAIAFFQKPSTNQCYEQRKETVPPICPDSDDPNAAWNVSLGMCMHKVPAGASERGSRWPEEWPARLAKPPYWLQSSQAGIYGKPADEDLVADSRHWKNVIGHSYLNGMDIDWSNIRNVMDMRAIYGGFAAALRDMKVWVMNVVPIDAPDTLPIIYERGLFGVYHDWCESFSTYPRTYDLLHANHLFSVVKNKCNYMGFIAEVDRILRPEGTLVVRDSVELVNELESILKSMHWEIRRSVSQDKEEGVICGHKTMWRPQESEVLHYAVDTRHH